MIYSEFLKNFIFSLYGFVKSRSNGILKESAPRTRGVPLLAGANGKLEEFAMRSPRLIGIGIELQKGMVIEMKTGVVLSYSEGLGEEFRWCMAHGIESCQLSVAPDCQTKEIAAKIKGWVTQTGMEITSLVGTWSGPNEWNFTHGPLTLGIVPPAYRQARMKELLNCAELAGWLSVKSICTHIGFIPENPSEPLYAEVVSAIRFLAGAYRERGISLHFETGQETPVTLLRIITEIGLDNVGLNFDPANLLMYGKANPIDALDIVGRYVKGVHAKDGEYPTNGYELGLEKPLGEGQVNFPKFIAKLKEIGYTGAVTIEREIAGEQQKLDIIRGNEYIKRLMLEIGE